MEQESLAWELERAECVALMATVPFGRIVFTDGALPAVTPVNFVLDPSGIVIKTRPGSRLAASVSNSVVAFQTDDIDVLHRAGWTVTVVGKARIVTEPLELDRLRRLPLQPWVGRDADAVVVVSLGLVTGRRIGGAVPVSPSDMVAVASD